MAQVSGGSSVDENTTFIVQGITGREAVNLTRECLDYGVGAKIVGGVTPGKGGTDVAIPEGGSIPVFNSVAEACAKELPLSLTDLKPQTSDKITLQDLDVDLYFHAADGGKPIQLVR